MTHYPAELVETLRLADGREVTIRPIRPADAGMEQDFVRHLSSDARYRRFMGTLRELPEQQLHDLTDIDYERHMALVATIVRDGREEEIGVARYITDTSGTRCEFAIVVADSWQGSGIAGRLMQSLMRVARARGVEVMEGFVLASNHPMLRFTRQLGFTHRPASDDPGMVMVERRLQPG